MASVRADAEESAAFLKIARAVEAYEPRRRTLARAMAKTSRRCVSDEARACSTPIARASRRGGRRA